MTRVARVVLLVIVMALGAVTSLGLWRTYAIQHSADQALFVAGQATTSELTGVWQGRVPGRTFAWQGKKFISAEQGINIFDNDGATTEAYPFRYYVAPSIRDRGLEVVKLDYNQPGNPWWLRFVLDEMVEIEPDHYLGKVHIRLLPGVSSALGYFHLKKGEVRSTE